MARTATKKKASATRKRTQRKKRPAMFLARVSFRKIVYFLALFCLLFFSVLMVGYVVFFRTVVAAELPFEEHDIHFEEVVPQGKDSTPSNVPSPAAEKLPQVAIIIDDMGYHPDVGRNLIALDLYLSFSFLPHAPFTQDLEEMVYQKGNPILLHLPLEPRSAEWDPGPGALFLKDDSATRRKKFYADLQHVPHATGVNNHMGSLFTEDRAAMEELVELFSEQQLFFIDSFTTSASTGLVSAREKQLPSARRHIFLDNVQNREAICLQIEKLVKLAAHQEHAIGIGHPYPETFSALNSCGLEMLQSVSVVGVDTLLH
jgi:polysaccharide deacetylase 2 family uncharacterized protein YibQ